MGYPSRVLTVIHKIFSIYSPPPHTGKWLVELGNGHIRDSSKREFCISYNTGKEYFESLGFNHRSIDINGLDKAVALDLSKPIENKFWHNRFDILVNSGMSTYVSHLQYGKYAQWECFCNIHKLVKVKGIYIHFAPYPANWRSIYKRTHVEYKENFFFNLAKVNNYHLLISDIISDPDKLGFDLFAVCLRKISDNQFCSSKDDFLSWINAIE